VKVDKIRMRHGVNLKAERWIEQGHFANKLLVGNMERKARGWVSHHPFFLTPFLKD